jgi:hypothetical protein
MSIQTLTNAYQAFLAIPFHGTVRVFMHPLANALGAIGFAMGAFLLTPVGGDLPQSCSFYATTRYPCPGCGLTRSVTSFLQGEWAMGFGYHPLGVVFAVLFAASMLLLLIPPGLKKRLLPRLSQYDAPLGRFLILFAVALVFFGILRIGLVWAGVPPFDWWKETDVPPFAEEYIRNHGLPEAFAREIEDD